MSTLARRIQVEKYMVRSIVSKALALGYTISVTDNEENLLDKSNSFYDITNLIYALDECNLFFENNALNYRGYVSFVFGNDGHDCIDDYSDSNCIERILREAMEYAVKVSVENDI